MPFQGISYEKTKTALAPVMFFTYLYRIVHKALHLYNRKTEKGH